jgi:hypothetical protein
VLVWQRRMLRHTVLMRKQKVTLGMGRDAELEYRGQLEEDDQEELEEQPVSQEEPEMQPRAVSEPLTEARLAAMEKAAEQVFEEEQEEGQDGSTETAE